MTAPLQGLVVVSVEQAIAAPLATRHLADLGATVIKVERPEGDFARHYDSVMAGNSANFVWANRGKQSVVLDLKRQRDVLTGLIAGADVFVHNLSPRAARDLGLDVDQLRASWPSLVACGISGYGSGGPRDDDKAYDLAIQAEAGVFAVTGSPEQMSKAGLSVADISAAMYAVTGILAAVFRRERTGEGASIRVSMLDSLVEWMSAPLYQAAYSGEPVVRTARRHHAIAPYGTFELSDGSTVLLAVQNDREFEQLTEHVLDDASLAQDPRFATNAARIANVEALEAIVATRLRELAPEDARNRLAQARIAVAAVNDLAGVWEHEQLRARQRFETAQTEHGPVEVLRPPLDISGWEPPAGAVPALGQHDSDLIRGSARRGRRPPGR